MKLCIACIFAVNLSAPAAQRRSQVKWLTPVKPGKNACPASALFHCSLIRSDAADAAASGHKATPPPPTTSSSAHSSVPTVGWPGWVSASGRDEDLPQVVTSPSTNRARCSWTSFIWPIPLPLCQSSHQTCLQLVNKYALFHSIKSVNVCHFAVPVSVWKKKDLHYCSAAAFHETSFICCRLVHYVHNLCFWWNRFNGVLYLVHYKTPCSW